MVGYSTVEINIILDNANCSTDSSLIEQSQNEDP